MPCASGRNVNIGVHGRNRTASSGYELSTNSIDESPGRILRHVEVNIHIDNSITVIDTAAAFLWT